MAGALMAWEAGPVVCFGEILLRLSPPAPRKIVQADALEVHVGGAEANVAAALASLGVPSRMISCLPTDPLGDRARTVLASTGVDMAHVMRSPGRMGLYFLEHGASLRPSAVTYDRADSAFAGAKPTNFDFTFALGGARLLHLSGITPALGPGGGALSRAAARAAQTAGVPICFDGNYRAQLWESWDSDPRAILTELVSMASLFIGNHRDISLLLGRSFSGDGPDRRREAAEAAFAAFPNLQLIASTARQVMGGGHHRLAARIDLQDQAHQTDEIDIPQIVDRIGTGDAFAAGVIHGWLNGGSAQAMAQSGLALAALKHSLPGDLTLFSAEDLRAFEPEGADVRR